MRQFHRRDIADHIDTTFRAMQERLRAEHSNDLREAQFTARKTNNGAAMLPAEAGAYIRHVRALTAARAHAIADAYTAFREPSGDAGLKDLTAYYHDVLAARRSAFQGQATLVAKRTGHDLSQLSGLLRSFEIETQVAFLEGKSILSKQTVSTTVQPGPQTPALRRAALSPSAAEAATKALICPETVTLGKLLWLLLRSDTAPRSDGDSRGSGCDQHNGWHAEPLYTLGSQ
jgi:hypothetical protein